MPTTIETKEEGEISTELIQRDEEERVELEIAAIKILKETNSAVLGKYSILRHEDEN